MLNSETDVHRDTRKQIQIQISTKRCGNKMAYIATMLPWQQTDGKMGKFGRMNGALRPKKSTSKRGLFCVFLYF